MKNLYMHTLDGRPAMYQPGSYVCFIGPYSRVNTKQMFKSSLKQIYKEQKASAEFHRKSGGGPPYFKYGYIRIRDYGLAITDLTLGRCYKIGRHAPLYLTKYEIDHRMSKIRVWGLNGPASLRDYQKHHILAQPASTYEYKTVAEIEGIEYPKITTFSFTERSTVIEVPIWTE